MDATGAWSWREGCVVDRDGDYLSLTHDDTGDELLALVGPPTDRAFPVEMLRPDDMDDTVLGRVAADVRRQLDFYLLEVGGDDPWNYAIYRCGTTSNLYSTVHWGWHPVDQRSSPSV